MPQRQASREPDVDACHDVAHDQREAIFRRRHVEPTLAARGAAPLRHVFDDARLRRVEHDAEAFQVQVQALPEGFRIGLLEGPQFEEPLVQLQLRRDRERLAFARREMAPGESPVGQVMDTAGRISEMTQLDWRIRYDRWTGMATPAGEVRLPLRMIATRDELRLTVVVDQWKLRAAD